MAGMYGIYAQTPYSLFQNRSKSIFKNSSKADALPGKAGGELPSLQNMFGQEATYEKSPLSEEMRHMIRELKQPQKQEDPYAGHTNGFLELSGSPDGDESDKASKPLNYNYKDVATKIQRAKTSQSAGQAVLSAKRKVLEVKRKISTGDGDPEELQIALTHAKRMEMAARKKKHHLELEEMTANTQKRDEAQDKLEEAADEMKDVLISAEEERLTRKEDEVFDEREEMIHEAAEEMSDELLEELGEMIAEFGEDELKEMEDMMEMLESMEIIDPHMSEEELEDLKRKHRAKEDKDIVKANMDYLKEMVKHQLGKSTGRIGSGGGLTPIGMVSAPAFFGASVSMPTISMPGGGSIDFRL